MGNYFSSMDPERQRGVVILVFLLFAIPLLFLMCKIFADTESEFDKNIMGKFIFGCIILTLSVSTNNPVSNFIINPQARDIVGQIENHIDNALVTNSTCGEIEENFVNDLSRQWMNI